MAGNNVEEQMSMDLWRLFLDGFILFFCKDLMKEKMWWKCLFFFFFSLKGSLVLFFCALRWNSKICCMSEVQMKWYAVVIHCSFTHQLAWPFQAFCCLTITEKCITYTIIIIILGPCPSSRCCKGLQSYWEWGVMLTEWFRRFSSNPEGWS